MLGNGIAILCGVLDAVVARDAAALNAEVERCCFEHGLAADDALAQLARALQRIALRNRYRRA